jgi:hypothetical protein
MVEAEYPRRLTSSFIGRGKLIRRPGDAHQPPTGREACRTLHRYAQFVGGGAQASKIYRRRRLNPGKRGSRGGVLDCGSISLVGDIDSG